MRGFLLCSVPSSDGTKSPISNLPNWQIEISFSLNALSVVEFSADDSSSEAGVFLGWSRARIYINLIDASIRLRISSKSGSPW
jgi:hypothetical protein